MTLAEAMVKLGFQTDQSSVKKVESEMQKLKSTATKLLGAIGISVSFSALNSLAETYSEINDQIKAATEGMGDQEDIQQAILEAANDSLMTYESMAETITSLIGSDEELFANLEDAAEFATLTAKALQVAGESDSSIASAQSVLNGIIADGEMSATNFSTIMKSYPELIDRMCEGLGVTQEELSDMCDEGEVTSETLVTAFSNAAEEIEADFEELDYSISDALKNISNQWGLFVEDLWEGSGLSSDVGKAMVEAFEKLLTILKRLQPVIERVIRGLVDLLENVVDKLDMVVDFFEDLSDTVGGVENAVKLLAIVFGSIWTVLNAGKIMTFVQNLIKGVSTINLKTMALIAVIIMIALLVEDFIGFLQGKDSVFETMLEEMGIDADEVRETISNVMEGIQEVLGGVVEWLGRFFEDPFAALLEAWDLLWETLRNLAEECGLSDAVDSAFEWLEKFSEDPFGTLLEAWNNLWETLINAADEAGITKAVEDAFQGAIDFLEGLPGEALQWGKDFIQGFIDGIGQMGANIAQAVSDLGENIAEYLGFSVPEKGPLHEYESWMPDFMQGLAEGIEGSEDYVLDAVMGLASGISAMSQTAAASIGTVTQAAASNAISNADNSVTQNVSISNSYTGNADAAAGRVKSTMKKSAEDATTYLARALAYGQG